MEVAKEIVTTITDPQGMIGPEVCMIIYGRNAMKKGKAYTLVGVYDILNTV